MPDGTASAHLYRPKLLTTWSEGYSWSQTYPWNQAYTWNSGYLWSKGYTWSQGYLWSKSTPWWGTNSSNTGAASPASIESWVPNQ